MIQATLDVLTMKAFRSDIRDHRIPFGSREITESLLGISAWRTGISLCDLRLNDSGNFSMGAVQTLDDLHDEELQEEITTHARRDYLRYAMAS